MKKIPALTDSTGLTSLIFKLLFIASFIMLLNGCGSWKLSQLWENNEKTVNIDKLSTASKNNDLHKNLDPTPLSMPQIPTEIQNLSTLSNNTTRDSNTSPNTDKLVYKVKIICEPKHDDIITEIQEGTKLYKFADSAPSNKIGLEFRISNDEIEIYKILKSYGYYSGEVLTTIDYNASPIPIKLNIKLNAQYKIAKTYIRYPGDIPAGAPTSLEKNGLAKGTPAISKDILASINTLSAWFKNNGYPFVKIKKTRYIIDKKNHTLVARITVNPGELVHMGNLILAQKSNVNSEYLNRIKTWKYGDVWNERKINIYINKLVQKNVFGTINIKPYRQDAKTDANTQAKLKEQSRIYDVLLEVHDSAQRSVSGGINYETDRGPGIKAFWEHRNIFSSTQNLTIETELRKDKQLVDISFTVPDFIVNNQTLLTSAWINNNITDAYEQKSARSAINIERILSRYWRFSIGATLEGGSIKESNQQSRAYSMIGIPMNLRFNSTRQPLNRSKGIVSALQITPYSGRYIEKFSRIQGKLDINIYYPILDDDKVVLALRTRLGTLFNDHPETVPASIRFYAGGSGSVRGYKFQSIGPHNERNNPIGGASLLELNLEARIKITETIGIVPFIDGGNVFHDAIPNLQKDALRWGAGIGMRYYTAIGPLRLDIATPLNPRKGDAPFFMYISIGQSF